MKFYSITVTYQVPFERVKESIPAHRDHLQTYYDQELILFSGVQYSQKGGAIIMKAPDDETVQQLIDHDPFYTEKLATYEVTAFEPRKYQPCVTEWIES